MLYINNSSNPYSEQRVSLGGNLFTIVFKFNSRNQSWYIDILDSIGEQAILYGIKLMPNQNLTGRYNVTDQLEGSLWCVRTKNDYSKIGRYNLGKGKTYRLVWVSREEELEAGISDTIQL